jgi:hypothetical protein
MPLVGGWWGAGAGLEAAVGPYVDLRIFEEHSRFATIWSGRRGEPRRVSGGPWEPLGRRSGRPPAVVGPSQLGFGPGNAPHQVRQRDVLMQVNGGSGRRRAPNVAQQRFHFEFVRLTTLPPVRLWVIAVINRPQLVGRPEPQAVALVPPERIRYDT